MIESGSCQAGSETEHPCLQRAVVEIWSVLFCESCARKQEAYFAIGELTSGKRGLGGRLLAEALNGLRREHTGGNVAPTSSRSTIEATGLRSRPGDLGVRAF